MLTELAFVIRIPHSPRLDVKGIWSIAITWNARTGITSGLFEGMSNADIHIITSYTSAKIKQSTHPLFFPTMLLDILTNLYIQHRKDLERALFVLEDPTGISRGQREKNAWNWDYDLYRETTTHCNTIYTGLVYLERRLDFTVMLSKFILDSLKFCADQDIYLGQMPTHQPVDFHRLGKQLEEAAQNAQNFAASQLHQTMCLQKRSLSLTTVVSHASFILSLALIGKRINIYIIQIYTIITQQDSRTNVKIAKAVKVDSTSMTAIAFLGIVFLPAMLVAVSPLSLSRFSFLASLIILTIETQSMFSMSMFDFSSPSTSSQASTSTPTSTAIVKSNFWMYWAVTIPLTLLILIIWKFWMGIHRNRDEKGVNDYLGTERVMAYRNKVNESMEINTPFYPGKGASGHLLLGMEENV